MMRKFLICSIVVVALMMTGGKATAYRGTGVDVVQVLPYAPGIWDSDEYIFAFEDLHSTHFFSFLNIAILISIT